MNHNHAPTAAAAPVIVPSVVAEACQQLHVTANLSLNQASRLCVAQCKSFIPRSTLRSLLRTCTFDETWGQGGQAGLLLELMLNDKMDLCAQFQKTTGNRIEAMVTVARLSGVWTIVEGGLIQARKEYFGMVIVLKRLQTLHRRHPTPQLADRICAARTVLNARLAPSSHVESAPGMACTGDYFDVSDHSHVELIQLNAVLHTAFGHPGHSKMRVTHVCYCTPEDRELAMMHPHKIMLDTTCKTNAGKKHFGYLSGNTTNHNWFKWFVSIKLNFLCIRYTLFLYRLIFFVTKSKLNFLCTLYTLILFQVLFFVTKSDETSFFVVVSSGFGGTVPQSFRLCSVQCADCDYRRR